MSTQISVVVDLGGLLKRNKQQTKAQRLAAQDASNTRQLRRTAETQRAAKLSDDGLTPDGTPKGTIYHSRRIDRKPAANRSVSEQIFFGPSYEPYIVLDPSYYGQVSSSNYYFIVNTTKVRNVANSSSGFIEGCTYLEGNEFINTGSGEVNRSSFEAGAGPNGTNALKLLSTRSFGLTVDSIGTVPPAIAGDKAFFYGTALTFECFIKTDFGTDSDYTAFDLWLEGCRIKVTNYGESYFRVYPSASGGNVTHSINVDTTEFESWTHLAIVLSNNSYKLYIAGNFIGAFSSINPEAYMEFRLFRLETGSTDSFRTDILWLSSLLLSNKARYSGTSFTPPTSIS